MISWSNVASGFESANETINFGARTLAEGDALFETITLAVISTDEQVTRNPSVQCFNQNDKVYLSIDNTFHVFSNGCLNSELFTTFNSPIDVFSVSSDGNLVVVCLNNGSIYCLHVPSHGKFVFSTEIEGSVRDKFFQTIFIVHKNVNIITFLIYSLSGEVYSLIIQDLQNVYDKLENNIDDFNENVNFTLFDKYDTNLLLTEINYENKLLITSGKYKRFFSGCGPLAFALSENGSIVAICKLTNLVFTLWNEEKVNDFYSTLNSNLNDHYLLLSSTSLDSEDSTYIKLLLCPEFKIKYQLKVSKYNYLVVSSVLEDNVMFIEGYCTGNSKFVNELRIKIIVNSNPEVRLKRLIRKKCFDEAIRFALTFGLNLQTVYKAQTEEYLIDFNFYISNVQEFCDLLGKINDIHFIVEHCYKTCSSTLSGIHKLLVYAHKRLHEFIQDNPDDIFLLNLKATILEYLLKLDTFKCMHCNNETERDQDLLEKWMHFVNADLFSEMMLYLKNGKIDKCALMFNRLKKCIKPVIDIGMIEDLLKAIPLDAFIAESFPIIREIITYCFELFPESLSFVLNRIYVNILHNQIFKPEWLENAIKFIKLILSALYKNQIKNLFFEQHFEMYDKSLENLKQLIYVLNELIVLKEKYGINMTLYDYLLDPQTVACSLLKRVSLNHIPNFIKNTLQSYVLIHKLDLDLVLSSFIKEIISENQEDILICVTSFICSESLKEEMILTILNGVYVPWNNAIETFVNNSVKEFPLLASKIKWLRESTAFRLLLKKYSVVRKKSYSDNEILLLIRNILTASKPNMLKDLMIIMTERPHLEEQCNVISFNHFLQIGATDNALQCLNNYDKSTMLRCCKSVLFSARMFLSSNKCQALVIENYMEVMNNIYEHLERIVPDYELSAYQEEIRKLNQIYLINTTLKAPEKITNVDADLSAYLTQAIGEIISEVEEHKIDWSEAVKKYKRLSRLTGISSEKCLFEFMKQSNSLAALIQTGDSLLTAESSASDMCLMAICIMKNIINVSTNDISITGFLNNDTICKESLDIEEAFLLAHKLSLQAYIKAKQEEIQTACELLNWFNICYWFRTKSIKWKVTPLFHPEVISTHLKHSVGIMKDLFTLYLFILEYNNVAIIKNNEESLSEKKILEIMVLFPQKIAQLQTEGYDLPVYELLFLFKSALNINADSELMSQMKQSVNATSVSYCTTQLLHKVMISKSIDLQLVYSILFYTPTFQSQKWFRIAVKTYKTDVNKLNAISTLNCIHSWHITKQYDEGYLNLKHRCNWWNKCLRSCISLNNLFQLDPDKILTKFLLHSKTFNVKLLQEFCTDFMLKIQTFLPLYLRQLLLNWKPEPSELSKPYEKNNELFKNCQKIISLMDNSPDEIAKYLNDMWQEVSFYQYEVYLCMLDLTKHLNPKWTNDDKNELLLFLKTYTRICQPQQKEYEEWQTTFPFKREIDPLSKFRLPFVLALFTKDVWEILRPEVNLTTYETWFEITELLHIDKDDICTYAVKETIRSGILRPNDEWTIQIKHDTLLNKIDVCVSQITDLKRATAVLHQALYEVSGGGDQVTLANMCWMKAKEWCKSSTYSEDTTDILKKLRLKYENTLCMQILHKNNLATQEYISLVKKPEELIKALYYDKSIIERTADTATYFPDINYAVDELTTHLGFDVIEMRTNFIKEFLEKVDDSDYLINNDNLKRVIYICESTDNKDIWLKLLYDLSNSHFDETMTMWITTPNLSLRVKAMQCFLTICDPNNCNEITDQSYKDLCIELEKLHILSVFENINCIRTVEELDVTNKINLIWKILQLHPTKVSIIRTVTKLCLLYNIWSSDVWNNILQRFIDLQMVDDLKIWLPKLYEYCYIPGLQSVFIEAWKYLITTCFCDDYIEGFLFLQTCPIISEINSCLESIFNVYFEKQQAEICILIVSYIQDDPLKAKLLQIVSEVQCDTQLYYEKLYKLETHGVLNTEFVINTLQHSNYQNFEI